jgi:putative metallo-beta-lactamase domain protein
MRKKCIFIGSLAALMLGTTMVSNAANSANAGQWKKALIGWLYTHADGKEAKNEWVKVGQKWYHFDKDGVMNTGWYQDLGDQWYYLDPDNGDMKTQLVTINGVRYEFNADGSWKHKRAAWVKSGSRWWYRHSDGSYTRNNWEKIDQKWYYFDGDGWMKEGWIQQPNGRWYYLNPGSGDMRIEPLTQNGKTYYFDRDFGFWIVGDIQSGKKSNQLPTKQEFIQAMNRTKAFSSPHIDPDIDPSKALFVYSGKTLAQINSEAELSVIIDKVNAGQMDVTEGRWKVERMTGNDKSEIRSFSYEKSEPHYLYEDQQLDIENMSEEKTSFRMVSDFLGVNYTPDLKDVVLIDSNYDTPLGQELFVVKRFSNGQIKIGCIYSVNMYGTQVNRGWYTLAQIKDLLSKVKGN